MIDPWVSSDYHLLKELKYGNKDLRRTNDIIAMHNKFVKPNDVFLFLGDISESEFFDQDKEKIMNELIKYCNRLNGIKILLTGNNDTIDIDVYKQMGFKEIYTEAVATQNYIFSHHPVPTANKLNLHGHIHGTKEYWNMNAEKHIDVYFGLYGQPVKLSYLNKYYLDGKYQGISKVVNEKEV